MSKTRLFAALALALLAAPALAQNQPPRLFGYRDFELEWKVEPLQLVLSARFLAARGVMRFEVLDGQGRAVVRNFVTGEALYILGHGQGGVYTFKAPPMGRFEPGDAGATETIGGESCRPFSAGPVTMCLSDDGIPLKLTYPQGTLTASRLIRQPQHPALFEPPPGTKAQPLPSSIPAPLLPF